MIPSGTGIMNVGGDDFTIRNNTVTGNSTFGVAILSDPLAPQDPRIEPNPDHNQVLRTLAINNGFLPPPNFTIPGADLFYDGSGRGNCFSQNIFGAAIPPNIEAAYPCAATMAPEPSTAALSGTAFSLLLVLFLSGRKSPGVTWGRRRPCWIGLHAHSQGRRVSWQARCRIK